MKTDKNALMDESKKANFDINEFAKELMRQILFNPKSNTQTAASSFTAFSKNDIVNYLQNPSTTTNNKNLRNASIYMYFASMHYQRLIQYYANLLTWSFVVSPLNFNKAKVKEEVFKKQLQKTLDLLELMNIYETMRNVLVVVLREGVYYGVKWNDASSVFFQKIPADYCKISSISDGVFLYSVDMSLIAENKLMYYPPEFTEMYQAYKRTGVKWQEVPAEISLCIKADPTIAEYSVPPFAATMSSLYSISTIENNQEIKDELDNYKMLNGQVPVDNEGNPLIPWDLVMKYYQNLSNAVGDKVGVSVTPFKLESFDFESSGSVADIDKINRAVNNYWTTAGTSGLLHGVANNTSGVTKLALKNDESFLYGIMKQAERWFNRYLKANVNGTIKFKITFLPITIFNREEYVKMYKESVAFGIGKSHYLAALGINPYDVTGLSYLENDIFDYDNLFKPLKNSHNATADSLSDAGRPLENDGEIGDSGEITRDLDANANR